MADRICSNRTRSRALWSICQVRKRARQIGVTLSVEDRILSTTVYHLFDVQSDPSTIRSFDNDTASFYLNRSNQCTLNDDDLISLDALWADDSDGEDLEDLDSLPTVGHVISTKLTTFVMNFLEPIKGHRVDAPLELPPSACYRDFSLVHFDHKAIEGSRPNTFVLPGSNNQLHTMSRVAEDPRFNGVPSICIVRSARDSKRSASK
jgi:hypothetical protein